MKYKITIAAASAAMGFASAFADSADDAQFYKYTNYNPDDASKTLKYEDFLTPTGNSRPQTWWHWINCNVSKQGIDADLKAMGDVGIGAAIIFNISGNSSNRMKSRTPEGPLLFNSPEWFENFKYVVKTGKKYGVDIGIHNCDGWSEAGGPWVTPEYAMKHLTWTIEKVEGNGAERTFNLKKPPFNYNYYKDIAVIAWPNIRPDSNEMMGVLKSVYSDSDETAPFKIDNWDGRRTFDVKATNRKFDMYGCVFELSEPFESEMLVFSVRRHWLLPRPVVLEASNDGKNFKKVADINFGSGEELVAFPKTKAKYWRISRVDNNNGNVQEWDDTSHKFSVKSFELVPVGGLPVKMPLIQAQLSKVNITPFRSAGSSPMPYDDLKVPDNAIIKRKNVHVFRDALDKDGNFKWKVPNGKWNIMRLGFTTSGKSVHPATRTGHGLEIDKMNADAVDFHFKSYVNKMIEAAGDDAGKVFKYIETDSWECGNQSWTAGLDKIFRQENGYDMLKFAPTFVGDCVDGKQQTEGFASDLRAVTSKLVMEKFYGRFGENTRAKGLKYESEPASEAFLNDPMYGFKVSDIPQHEIWQSSRFLSGVNGARFSTEGNGRWGNVPSVAHFYGKEITTCESLSQNDGNWTDCPSSLKGTSDTIILSGYNTMVFHSYTHQPDERVPGWQMEPWGSTINRKMPWFLLSRPWFDYLARAQYMTQRGKSGARILNFVSDRVPVENGVIEAPEGIEIDMVNGDGVRNYLRVENGKFVSPGRMEYDVMTLNKGNFLRLDTLKKLKQYVEAGATIAGYYYDGRYDTNVGGKKSEREWKALNKELFGSSEKAVRKIGKGKVLANFSTKEAAEELGIKPYFVARDVNGEMKFDNFGWAYNPYVRWIKRIHNDGTVWFWVLNTNSGTKSFVADFDVVGKDVSLWYPETGEKRTAAAVVEKDGYTSVPLDLAPNSNVFVVFEPSRKNARVKTYSINGAERFPNMKIGSGGISTDAVSDNFTMTFTVTPKIDIPRLKEANSGIINFDGKTQAVPAQGKHNALGNAHTGTGVLVGHNGIAVIEHGANYRSAVLTHYAKIAPDTKVAVVYKDKVPSLYINGKFVKSGMKSPRTPHPSDFSGGFEGSIGSTALATSALDEKAIRKIANDSKGISRKATDLQPVLSLSDDGKVRAEFFEAGQISGELSDGTKFSIASNGIAPTPIKPPYEVEFNEKFGGPAKATFDSAISWTASSDLRIKHYSGVAKYTMYVDVDSDKVGANKKSYIDFASVGDVARVWVNGNLAGTAWKYPYRLDITKFLKAGKNKIEAEVGSSWANRCLYDATLPPEKRITWGNTQWFHYPEANNKDKLTGTWGQGPIPSGIYGGIPLILHSEISETK